MIKRPPKRWQRFLESSLESLLQSPTLAFKDMKPSSLPKRAGVYLVTVHKRGKEEPYYVGRTTNLRRRLYTNHLMGPTSNSQLKKYLIDSDECADREEAKQFLRRSAQVRWIEEEEMRVRGALEDYITAVLLPKYGISPEH
ncbi:MAG: GIY-YIG nuclease family protein [Candidatus Thorarchaeota archaeon]